MKLRKVGCEKPNKHRLVPDSTSGTRRVSLVSLSLSPDTLSLPSMSSPPPSPSPNASSTLPVSSPPFTPVRNASKKLSPASVARDASSRPALTLVTPSQTPLGPANRFGVLALNNRAPRLDPKTPAGKSRVPLTANNSPVEGNWRSTRKRDPPPTPTGPTGECRVSRLWNTHQLTCTPQIYFLHLSTPLNAGSRTHKIRMLLNLL